MNRRVIFPRSLQYLIAIAEYSSYTRAAEALHVSQPTLSQQIKHLEESLQTPLLDRSGRTVQLTDAGEIYLRHARRAWLELDSGTRAINDVQDLTRGSMRLGWTPITDYMTCCLLENFNSRYPGITLDTLEMPQDDIAEAVTDGRIDIGIAFSKPFSENDKATRDVEIEVLFEDNLCLAVGNTHPYAGTKQQINLDEFSQESLALLNTDFELRHVIDRYCVRHEIAPRISISTNSLSVIIEMIQIGELSTVLPSSIIHTQCGLNTIELVPQLPRKAVTLIRRKCGYKSPACMAFAALASEWAVRRLKETPVRRRQPCPFSEGTRKRQTKLAKEKRPAKGSKATA